MKFPFRRKRKPDDDEDEDDLDESETVGNDSDVDDPAAPDISGGEDGPDAGAVARDEDADGADDADATEGGGAGRWRPR